MPARLTARGLAALAVVAAGLGVMYVTVACESLPGFLGAVPGDAHPRTQLGAALLGLAIILAIGSLVVRIRRGE